MSTDKLTIFNIALSAVGERALGSLSEATESRRILDELWDRGQGAIRFWLAQGYWNHGIRAIQLDASDSVDESFGLQHAFDLPSDFVKLVSIASDEYFSVPLEQYEIESGFIVADIDPIYLRYVSDDADFGGDLSLWPESFIRWTGHDLATQIAPRLKNDIDQERLQRKTRRLLIEARSQDAQQEPPRFPPLSSWASARLNQRQQKRDRGSRTTLIG